MKLTTTRTDARRAAVFVLAVAADDGAQIAQVFEECAASQDRMAALKLCLELAELSARFAEKHDGPEWRSAMGSAIVDLELSAGQSDGASDVTEMPHDQALGRALSLWSQG